MFKGYYRENTCNTSNKGSSEFTWTVILFLFLYNVKFYLFYSLISTNNKTLINLIINLYI